jgi:PSP1 C-terminal conserved region
VDKQVGMEGAVMEQEPGYLIRYGLMGHVGKFAHEPAMDFVLDRGQAVVIRTDRGEEVGEVLVPVGIPASASAARDEDAGRANRHPAAGSERSAGPGLLRPASAQDLEDARRSAQLRSERYQVCQRLCGEQSWPLEVIDVEPLLDQKTTVVHYLGPRDLDLALLRAQIRRSCDFDIIFEPVGSDHGTAPEAQDSAPAIKRGGGCGDCDCSGGKCGTTAADTTAHSHTENSTVSETRSGGCGSSSHSGGCSSCGIAAWKSDKGRTRP